MIKRLMDKDNAKLMAYLIEEREINLFMIGDIENYGYDEKVIKIWTDLNERDEIVGVLLRYRNFYIVYSKGDYNAHGFADIINASTFDAVSGKKDTLLKIKDLIEHKKYKEFYFAKITKDKFVEGNEELALAQKATADDVDDILQLRETIEEFDGKVNRKVFEEELEKNLRRVYFVKEDDKCVAEASTTAENSQSAMIVGVCTDKDYRRKGYATICVKVLCKDLFKKDKTLCLFYDNPNAGRIYKRIGFEDIDKWITII
ncbi:GNAT family N-acetyltransferase [Abyssisolibacter fermentans]|uniref:GNAT family N-acetyltransferase n=1 Tax=Abyssisolibacter fermentans TaxID=1766203 RepID=UPI0008359594|nr:GNAT family N-acetyltransferase [Abyssisolibacter fermentans]